MLTLSYPPQSPEPPTPLDLLRRLHAGQLFVYRARAETRALIQRVHEVLRAELGASFVPGPGQPCPAIEHSRLGAVRAALYGQADLPVLAAKVLSAFGLPEHTLVDTPRLRVVTAGAEHLPQARPVFVAHRDTWYGCPQEQINWWVPVFDCPHEQSFAFYPEYFDAEVSNASGRFDYARWMKEVGWHGTTDLEAYPAPTQGVPGAQEVRLPTQAGDLLLFASAHLHQTRPNTIAASSRLSLDFRSVLPDGPVAPNRDNYSVGADARVQEQFRSLATLLS